MRSRILLLGLTLIIAAVIVSTGATSQGQENTKRTSKPAGTRSKPEPSPEEAMAVWMKYAEPGEGHKLLKSFEGTWAAAVKAWMAPGAPPTESQGTMENKLILGGRFLHEEYRGDFMGKPFSGLGLIGYDNFKKKYTAIWTDTMSTSLWPSLGTFDPSSKVLTSSGQFDDVISGKRKTVKTVTRILDENKHVFEWYEEGKDGKLLKTMEITYTRK